ncbi:MAG: hypothetical protein JOS17DRAFT_282086 [Linnemannia elongata]|nr:MAG: hypothetical protein JOS17DRAFT_282086 [Linnemannia elongata]
MLTVALIPATFFSYFLTSLPSSSFPFLLIHFSFFTPFHDLCIHHPSLTHSLSLFILNDPFLTHTLHHRLYTYKKKHPHLHHAHFNEQTHTHNLQSLSPHTHHTLNTQTHTHSLSAPHNTFKHTTAHPLITTTSATIQRSHRFNYTLSSN